jgi:hypothetical protein
MTFTWLHISSGCKPTIKDAGAPNCRDSAATLDEIIKIFAWRFRRHVGMNLDAWAKCGSALSLSLLKGARRKKGGRLATPALFSLS